MQIKGLISEGALQRVLAEADSPAVRSWVLAVLSAVRDRFPRCDFYVLNRSGQAADEPRIYIGIGARQPNTDSGRNALILVAKNKNAYLGFQRKGQFDENYGKRVSPNRLSATEHSDLANVKHWLDQLDQALNAEDRRAFQGETRTMDDYLGSPSPARMSAQTIITPIDITAELSLNQILFGPPGTGKTYSSINAALRILDPGLMAEPGIESHGGRDRLKARFDELVQQDRIRFVTFHQSFSYEDFVEGLRATTDDDTGQLRYEVVDGVFKALCDAAAAKVTQKAEAPSDLDKRRVWKMSLGNTLGDDASIYQECLANDYVLLGYGAGIDFAGCTDRKAVQERFAQRGVQPENPSIDYGITSVTAFVCKMQKGDLIVVSDGNFKFRAIGEVTGDYQFKQHADFENAYAQMRSVKWLRQYEPSLPHTELLNAQFSQMTLYQLRPPTLDREKLKGLLDAAGPESDTLFQVGQRFGQGYVVRSVGAEVVEFDKPRGGVLPLPLSIIKQLLAYTQAGQVDADDIRQGRVFEKVAEADLEKYIVNGYQSLLASLVEQLLLPADRPHTNDARVLIIDEINRGNVSRIFGELITLIEPSKRAGADEALSVVLPYSKQRFSVPSNVHLIGTMNTADRSLSGLDIALRRRFTFTEMPPKPELLDSVRVEGVNVGQLLRVMNQRIEVLLDRDHCLGHAYFMSLKDGDSLYELERIFRNQILPLLQEYFFEDWQRIQWILNDHRKAAQDQFVRKATSIAEDLFGTGTDVPQHDLPWELNEDALSRVEAYLGIIDHQATPMEVTSAKEATEGPYTVRLLSTGSIELLRDGQVVSPAMPVLRELASKLQVSMHSKSGSEVNTRLLGSKVIAAIKASKN